MFETMKDAANPEKRCCALKNNYHTNTNTSVSPYKYEAEQEVEFSYSRVDSTPFMAEIL